MSIMARNPFGLPGLGGGLGGGIGSLSELLAPLRGAIGRKLTENIGSEKIDPFMQEVEQIAQSHFGDLFSNGGGNTVSPTPMPMPMPMPLRGPGGSPTTPTNPRSPDNQFLELLRTTDVGLADNVGLGSLFGGLGASPTNAYALDQFQTSEMTQSPAGGIAGFVEGGRIEGPGTGTSDSIPAMIYQDGMPVQEARLSTNEVVLSNKDLANIDPDKNVERAATKVGNAKNGTRGRVIAKMYNDLQRIKRGK